MSTRLQSPRDKLWFAACMIFLALVSFNNIFRGYEIPANFFWDENYHVASAQKYLHGIFFMEPHPPLGKLLIALGEYLLEPNGNTSQFLDTTYASLDGFPEGMSFRGYRLFPVLFASCCPLLLFCLLFLLTQQMWISLAVACLFLFDNALVVHLRGAMLEGFQLFFALLVLIAFTILYENKYQGVRRLAALLFGASLALLISIKANGAVLFVLPIILAYRYRNERKAFVALMAGSGFSFVLLFLSVWQIHFQLLRTVNPKLEHEGFFTASDSYREAFARGEQGSLALLPRELSEAWRFFKKYEEGVPKLNLCKESENGSPAYFWPIGARSISYRWEKTEGLVRYLYLQVNPFVWALGLLAVLLSALLLGARVFYPQLERFPRYDHVGVYFFLYLSYLFAVLQIPRVMYLYHYFLALLFSFVLLGLLLYGLPRIGEYCLTPRRRTAVAGVCGVGAFFVFLLYAPLTYFQPVSNHWLSTRALLSIWDLHCANCSDTNTFARPLKDAERVKLRFGHMKLSGLTPLMGQQEWGEPRMARAVGSGPLSVAGETFHAGFGVHAKSVLSYALSGTIRRFRARVGVTEDVAQGGSVVFEVYGDANLLFRSSVMEAGKPAESVDVDLSGKKNLRLQVLDAGDGNENDHAAWGDPSLE